MKFETGNTLWRVGIQLSREVSSACSFHPVIPLFHLIAFYDTNKIFRCRATKMRQMVQTMRNCHFCQVSDYNLAP
jgi:hypothetical protein